MALMLWRLPVGTDESLLQELCSLLRMGLQLQTCGVQDGYVNPHVSVIKDTSEDKSLQGPNSLEAKTDQLNIVLVLTNLCG